MNINYFYTIQKNFVFLLFLFSCISVRAQLTTVWSESFNGLTYGSAYNNGVTGYWNNSTNPPQNSQINGAFEVATTVAGQTQVPTDAAGGRFLMFWTHGGITIPAAQNTFFKKNIATVPGRTYSVSFKMAQFSTSANPPNVTVKAFNSANNSQFYTSSQSNVTNTSWQTFTYSFTVPVGVTSVDVTLENTSKQTTGNDFAIDDILIQWQCNAGATIPSINPATNYTVVNSSYSIPCGSTTANISGITASNKPAPATVTLTWHTGTPATTANKIANVTALTGTTKYYAAFFDSVNNCYSPTKEVIVLAPICADDNDFTSTPINTNTGGTLPSIFANDSYNGATITDISAITATYVYELWTPANATINNDGTLTIPAGLAPGIYKYYYKLRDTDPDIGSLINDSRVAEVVFIVENCTNPPNTNPATDFTQTGISTLVGFTGGTTGWPQNVPNGFVAIESKNSGFVITRVKTVNDIPTAQRVEGMLVYDIQDACVKLYNGAYWKCLEKDCGIPTN